MLWYRRLRPGLLLVAALTACETRQPQPELPAEGQAPMSESSAAPLVPTLQVEQFSDSVRLNLRITNSSGEPLELVFPTGQSFDFVVLDGDQEVWRWSANMMFTQAFRTEAIGAGETRTHQATWTPEPDASGAFTVRGILTAQDHRVEQETEISLP